MLHIFQKKDGSNLVLSEEELIESALKQEREGIGPHYVWYDYKAKKAATNPGWLVVSVWGGCCVVYRRNDGKMIIREGWQGDFCYV